jgi:electron transfer flavoprotein alpha subunit
LAGIKTSETIVSVNIDPDAPLHRLADLGIVGDAFAVLGELQKRLDAIQDEGRNRGNKA